MAFLHHRRPSESNMPKPCSRDCLVRLPPHCAYCFLPDPPPPPPPPRYDINQQSNQFKDISPLMIIIIMAILGSCFLLVSYFAIFLKYCSINNNSRRPETQSDETHVDFIDENHSPVMLDHPIWFINTVGLEQSIINSIAVFKYKKGDGLIEGTECSVCLNEFQEDEDLRLLPKCSHAFHIPCIDTWLRSHTNCPLCRAGLVSNPVRSNSTAMVSNSGTGEEIQVENSESDVGLGSDQSVESGVSDLRVQVEDEGELQDGRTNIEITKESVPSPLEIEKSELRAVSDLGENHRVVEKGIQPGRRSVSLDFSSMFCFSIANSLPLEAEGSSSAKVVGGGVTSKSMIISKSGHVNPSIFRLMGSSSKGRMLQKGPVLMKRSFSSSGKFLSSRYSRNRNSILPL